MEGRAAEICAGGSFAAVAREGATMVKKKVKLGLEDPRVKGGIGRKERKDKKKKGGKKKQMWLKVTGCKS